MLLKEAGYNILVVTISNFIIVGKSYRDYNKDVTEFQG